MSDKRRATYGEHKSMECPSAHRSTGTFGYPVPGVPEWPEGERLPLGVSHASVAVCDRDECRKIANRYIRAATGHDGIYTSYAEARAKAGMPVVGAVPN